MGRRGRRGRARGDPPSTRERRGTTGNSITTATATTATAPPPPPSPTNTTKNYRRADETRKLGAASNATSAIKQTTKKRNPSPLNSQLAFHTLRARETRNHSRAAGTNKEHTQPRYGAPAKSINPRHQHGE